MSNILLENYKRFFGIDLTEKDKDDPCWDGYEQYGMKMKDGKEVPNCVPIGESREQLGECKNCKRKLK